MSRWLSLVIAVVLVSGCASSNKVNVAATGDSAPLSKRLAEADRVYEEARLPKAETLYLGIVRDHPKSTNAWLRLGNIYMRQGRVKGAIRCFEEVLKLDPKDGRAWYNLSLARVRQAIDTLEQGEKVVPIDSAHHIYLVELHSRLNSKMSGEQQ
ncbi:tetratricopeptide repeat protein [Pleionea litopenaei]|uniref:Tetratricopeptide repeat protein n=1 Tax=Pleionea litopenaei TaxID=3070815 RepID=A0AA51RTE5_9GAMM|nr:tetratricopeptide repeat protein [Pleionea sp. HL-JVS1]WMS87255.1 tetratricopeptide repeat protein [Pleionea sp. HL-JVS1]